MRTEKQEKDVWEVRVFLQTGRLVQVKLSGASFNSKLASISTQGGALQYREGGKRSVGGEGIPSNYLNLKSASDMDY